MESKKYIGLDVHQASISAAVRDEAGKLVMECVIETKASTVLEFIRGLRGTLYVTFEEGTSAVWLYDLLKPHVAQVVVCDPRKNALLKAGLDRYRLVRARTSGSLACGYFASRHLPFELATGGCQTLVLSEERLLGAAVQ